MCPQTTMCLLFTETEKHINSCNRVILQKKKKKLKNKNGKSNNNTRNNRQKKKIIKRNELYCICTDEGAHYDQILNKTVGVRRLRNTQYV